MERAVVLAEDGNNIAVSHLSEKILRGAGNKPDSFPAEGRLKDMVEGLEKRVIMKTMEEYRTSKRVTNERLLGRGGQAYR